MKVVEFHSLVGQRHVRFVVKYKGEQDSQIWMPECDSFPRFSSGMIS